MIATIASTPNIAGRNDPHRPHNNLIGKLARTLNVFFVRLNRTFPNHGSSVN
jgi:hypothetical protein